MVQDAAIHKAFLLFLLSLFFAIGILGWQGGICFSFHAGLLVPDDDGHTCRSIEKGKVQCRRFGRLKASQLMNR